MNRYAIVPALALLVSATAGAAVDPNLLGLVMPEAKVLYGVQVQQTLASPFGQFAISHLPQNAAMTRFEAATGFDLQRDLREILVASSSTGNLSDGSDVLVLASGAFAPDKVLALAGVIGAKVSDYQGVSMITPPQQHDARVFAFLDASTIAIGSESAVRGVIDRRSAQAVFAGPLFQKALDASATHDAWFATVTPLTDLIPANSTGGFDPTALLQSVIESWVGVHFDINGLTLAAEALTHSPNEAQGLAGMLKLVSGMLKGTPAAALQNAQISASGAVMRVILTVPEQDLERSFPGAAPRRAAR
ncbi:MAG TPA: hypothetical protein VG456_25405 [Candidatus Sulfopaludibacter sp.]|jgi:hypothetical protein|nr:hypothetical protein [Candidatus Sulfopaludibacter sp.]